MIYSHCSPCPFGALMGTLSGAQSRAQSAFPHNQIVNVNLSCLVLMTIGDHDAAA